MDISNDADFIRHDWVDIYDESSSAVSLLSDIRYSGHTPIGEGGLKKVYKAFDNHCDRWVAIARISGTSYTMGDSLDFIREIQLNSTLEHQNIIRIYDIGIDEDGPWFTMELLDGDTLSKYLTKSTPTTNERLNIFSKICDALAAAHKADTLHLDLKPENIIIGELEKLTVYDWGLGEQQTLSLENSSDHYIKGTPGFMAPEQLVPGSPTTKQTDVFGLAALLYFILTGKSPIAGTTQDEKKANTLSTKLNSLDHLSIPKRLIPLLKKGLSAQPSDRFENAHQLNTEIKQYIEGHATEVENASPLMLVKLFIQRNKTASFISLLAFAALLLTSSFYILSLNNSQKLTQSALNESLLAKKAAELKRKEAESSQLIAEQTLSALRKEQDLRMTLNSTLIKMMNEDQKKALSDYDMIKARKIAKSLAAQSPNKRQINSQLAITYFVVQNFQDSLEFFHKADLAENNDLESIAKKYPFNKKQVTLDILKKVIQEIKPGRAQLISYLLHYSYETSSLDRHLKVVEFVFRKYNPGKKLSFNYQKGTQKLTIKGTNLIFRTKDYKAKEGAHLLSSLPIKKLSIDNNPSYKKFASRIKHTSIEELVFH